MDSPLSSEGLGVTLPAPWSQRQVIQRQGRGLRHMLQLLREKKVLVTGTIDDMMTQDHPWIREYFHGPRGRAAVAAKSMAPKA